MPPMLGSSQVLLGRDHAAVYYAGMPVAASTGGPLRRHGDEVQVLPGGYFRALGRVDDTMNLGGIKVGGGRAGGEGLKQRCMHPSTRPAACAWSLSANPTRMRSLLRPPQHLLARELTRAHVCVCRSPRWSLSGLCRQRWQHTSLRWRLWVCRRRGAGRSCCTCLWCQRGLLALVHSRAA